MLGSVIGPTSRSRASRNSQPVATIARTRQPCASIWEPESGYVGCCDSSSERHATHDANASGHPIVRAQRSGEVWRWRYMDRVGMKIRRVQVRAHPPIASLRMTLKPSARWPQYAGLPGQEVASS